MGLVATGRLFTVWWCRFASDVYRCRYILSIFPFMVIVVELNKTQQNKHSVAQQCSTHVEHLRLLLVKQFPFTTSSRLCHLVHPFFSLFWRFFGVSFACFSLNFTEFGCCVVQWNIYIHTNMESPQNKYEKCIYGNESRFLLRTCICSVRKCVCALCVRVSVRSSLSCLCM